MKTNAHLLKQPSRKNLYSGHPLNLQAIALLSSLRECGATYTDASIKLGHFQSWASKVKHGYIRPKQADITKLKNLVAVRQENPNMPNTTPAKNSYKPVLIGKKDKTVTADKKSNKLILTLPKNYSGEIVLNIV